MTQVGRYLRRDTEDAEMNSVLSASLRCALPDFYIAQALSLYRPDPAMHLIKGAVCPARPQG